MRRSGTASASNDPPKLPSKSAWVRGPPQNSATTTPSHSQPPAPSTPTSATNLAIFHATHFRRSSTLGQGVSIKDDANIPRSAVKQGSAVIFGSIDDASAPISSSPAFTPVVKPADSVAVQNDVPDAAQSAVTNRPPPLFSIPSTPSSHPAPSSASTPVSNFDKKSIVEPFAGPSTQSVPTPTTWAGYYYHPQFIPGIPPGPPSMPFAANRPTVLSSNAGAFIPGKKISIKNPSGQEVTLDALKRVPPPIVQAVSPSPAPVKNKNKNKKKRPIPTEGHEQKEDRLAVREGKTSESFLKANDDAARRQIEEQELRRVEERKLKEGAERAEKERKETEEQTAREETERKEAELRVARKEEERKGAEERTARKAHETEERDKERLRLEEEVRAQREPRNLQTTITGNSAPTLFSALATARHIEYINRISYPEGIKHPKVELNVNAQKGKFRYDRDFLLQFMNVCKEKPDNLTLLDVINNRPGLRNLQTTLTSNSAPTLPSALATARHIEDINRIFYSEGVKNPKVGFNVNAQEGKFRADTASIVPIESLLPGSYTKSLFTSRARLTEPGARPASFLGTGSGESESETPGGSRRQRDDSFLRHSKYFFDDGNVTFLVNGFLYCVHRYLFSHDSLYFSTRFAQLGIRNHEALSSIIPLADVECEDFEAFLSVLYPHLKEHDFSYEQWRSVLHLSTRWGFASHRKLVLESINPPTPYDWLLLARKYAVVHWVVPALTALCERTAPLSLDEARGMNIADVVLVATVREDIFRFGVSAAEVPRRVEALQAEVPVRVAGDHVSLLLASSTSGATKQRPGSTANATIDSDLEVPSCNSTTIAVTEPVDEKTPMRGGNLAGATTKSQGEYTEQSHGEQRWRTTNLTSNSEWDMQTTKAASNDEWGVLPFNRNRLRTKRTKVAHNTGRLQREHQMTSGTCLLQGDEVKV